jgi:uncharacterized protein (DUF1330 family)
MQRFCLQKTCKDIAYLQLQINYKAVFSKEFILSAYVIANLTVHDPRTFRKYRSAVVPIVEKYGGKYLIVDLRSNDLDGESRPLLLMGEFESVDDALCWYNSPEYQEIIPLRQASSEGWVRLASKLLES